MVAGLQTPNDLDSETTAQSYVLRSHDVQPRPGSSLCHPAVAESARIRSACHLHSGPWYWRQYGHVYGGGERAPAAVALPASGPPCDSVSRGTRFYLHFLAELSRP